MPAPRRSRHWWQEQVAALEHSGMTHQQFAAARGVAVASLRHWLYAERRAREVAALAPLSVVDSGSLVAVGAVG